MNVFAMFFFENDTLRRISTAPCDGHLHKLEMFSTVLLIPLLIPLLVLRIPCNLVIDSVGALELHFGRLHSFGIHMNLELQIRSFVLLPTVIIPQDYRFVFVQK